MNWSARNYLFHFRDGSSNFPAPKSVSLGFASPDVVCMDVSSAFSHIISNTTVLMLTLSHSLPPLWYPLWCFDNKSNKEQAVFLFLCSFVGP